jgi:hypothetical protein
LPNDPSKPTNRLPITKDTTMVVMTKVPDSATDLITSEQAAVRLRVSAYTLARWRVLGTGPKWCRVGPKKVYYRLADLDAFLGRA